MREKAYRLLAKLFTQHPLLQQGSTSSGSGGTSSSSSSGKKDDHLRHAVRCALLQGLADPDTTGMRQHTGGGVGGGADGGEGDEDEEEHEIDGGSISYGTQDVGDFDFEEQFISSSSAQAAVAVPAALAAPPQPKREIGIRRFLFDFWSEHAAYLGNGGGGGSDKGRSSSTLQSRLKQLLGDLWDASVAPQWVHYSAFLLLDQVCCFFRIFFTSTLFFSLLKDSCLMLNGTIFSHLRVPRSR